MNEILGCRIKALRSANNYNQEQIADQIGISRQKYARIERGVNSITLDILSKIAKVLGVEVVDITGALDEIPVVQYRSEEENESSKKIFDMLDLFYANKHMYVILHLNDTNTFVDDNITINGKSSDEKENEANYFEACFCERF